jgi:hypothetical protein
VLLLLPVPGVTIAESVGASTPLPGATTAASVGVTNAAPSFTIAASVGASAPVPGATIAESKVLLFQQQHSFLALNLKVTVAKLDIKWVFLVEVSQS